ncbi:MBL fold metallo-hydrolase [Candidatus Pelagibacter sp.]|nr:MBL fold metallo-hydrolase [Candidatus Pelagibacter sp.]
MKTKFIILGCGSSLGVPRADGFWGKCDKNVKQNYRTRCSAIIKGISKNILIDTSPDIRYQLITNKIKNIHSVIYSHQHGDQVHGINDLRVFAIKNSKKIPIYADRATKKYLNDNFHYCFNDTTDYKAILTLNNIKKKFFFLDKNKKIEIKTFPVEHGSIQSQSIIVNDKCAYISDSNRIYNKDLNNFKNLKYLIIDCLRINPHPSHFSLGEVLKLTQIIKPKKTILTNMHSDLDYNYLLKNLPKNIIPGYDGLSLDI